MKYLLSTNHLPTILMVVEKLGLKYCVEFICIKKSDLELFNVT